MYGAIPGTQIEKHYLLTRLRCQKYCGFLYSIVASPRRSNRFLKLTLGLPVGALIALIFHYAIVVNIGVPERSRNFIAGLFAISIIVGFGISTQVRCITLLMLPSMFGTQGRGFVEAFALTLILAGPVNNIIGNSREATRAILCSGEMAQNFTVEKSKMRLAPLRNVVSDIRRKSLKMQHQLHEVKKKFMPINMVVDIPDDIFDKVKVEARETEEESELDESRFEKIERRLKEAKEKKQESTAKIRSKSDVRCEDILNHGVHLCKEFFADKYKGCCKAVPLGRLDDLICWPFLLDGVCNILKLIPKLWGFECNSADIIPDEFEEAFTRAKEAAKALSKNFKVTIAFKSIFSPEALSLRTPEEMMKDIQYNFEKQEWFVKFIMKMFRKAVAFLFLFMIWVAAKYHKRYLSDMSYDNTYLTMYFRWVDFRRQVVGKPRLLPLRKLERNEVIEMASLKLLKHEKMAFANVSATIVVRCLAFGLIMFVDKVICEALQIIRDTSATEFEHQGKHHLKINVDGTGFIARLIRDLLEGFNTHHEFHHKMNNDVCLPAPRRTETSVILTIWLVMLIVWILAVGQAYAMRLRVVIAGFFYPKRAKKRALFLYNKLVKKRRLFLHTCRKKVERKVRLRTLEVKVGIMEALIRMFPAIFGWFKRFGFGKRKCLICEEVERWDFIKCPSPFCPFGYCAECWKDIDARCYACRSFSDWSSSLPSTEGDMQA